MLTNIFRILLYLMATGWFVACVATTPPPSPVPAVTTQAEELPAPVVAAESSPTQPVQPAQPAASQPSPPPPAAAPAVQAKESGPAEIPVGPGRYTTTRILRDGIHDASNPQVGLLQDPAAALAKFPMGKRSELDWVQTLNEKAINPRANLQGSTSMEVLDLDVIMTNTKNMYHVKFPHKAHTQWLACSNCHPAIFEPKKGANPVDMNKIFRGQYCGQCHGRVAFSVMVCERCHSVPHPGAPKAWW